MATPVPNSYKDPYWVSLSENTEKKLGLPDGMLRSVLLYGERSNNDQVSSADARTPYQIIPSARNLAIKAYGVDPYLSPENAAEVAGRFLKDSLDRNKGDKSLAFAEYHGGTNPQNWGPITKSYISRTMTGLSELTGQQTGQPQTRTVTSKAGPITVTYKEEVPASDQMESRPVSQQSAIPDSAIANIFQAYSSGRMSPEEVQQYESDVRAGRIMIPPGASLQGVQAAPAAAPSTAPTAAPTANMLPDPVLEAYRSGRMNPQERADLERDVASGLVGVPEGFQLGQPIATGEGLMGAVTRGLAPIATGAAIGAAAGAPFAGVGAVPGAIAGAGAMAGATLVADPVVSAVNSLLGTQFTMPTQAIENLLTRVGVPQAKTAAERILQSTVTGAAGAGGLASAGRAIQTAAAPATVSREVGRQLGAQPVAQVAGGAGAGAAGAGAREAELGTGAELAASLVGGVAGGVAGQRATMPRTTGARQPLPPEIAQAESERIRLLTSDVRPPRTFPEKILQTAGERVPFVGTSGMRQAQQVERIDAVRNVLRDFGADDVANLSDDVMKDLATKRIKDIQKYTKAKKEVIDRLSNKGIVPVTQASQAIDDQIAILTRRRTEGSDEAIERLKQIKDDLKDRDLFQLEAYRQDELAKIFMDDPARPMSIAARDAGEKALRAVYDPLRKDMTDFIKQVGERRDVDKFMVSNKRLSETASDMRNASLKSVLLKGDVKPEVIENLLFRGKPSEVRALYSKLTPQGRATARAAILAKAGKDATVDVAEGSVISPDRFANNVKKMGDSVGVFFTGDDLKRIEGLIRVLNITKRATEAAAAPATGVQAVPFIIVDTLSSTFGGPAGATVAAGTVGGLARIYESAPVRNLLLQMSKAKPGSAEEAALAKRLLSTIQTQAEAVQDVGREVAEVLE
jgi:uncharacterized protein YdcH (DUF465 family)